MIAKTENITKKEFTVAGISVRTINKNGESGRDIKALWDRFMTENVFGQLKEKLSGHIYCVYTEYETDYKDYYTTVLGFEVNPSSEIPDSFDMVTIPQGIYREYSLSGKCHQNVLDAWEEIWKNGADRIYTTDYEKYAINVMNFEDSEVEIFVAIK